MSFELGITLPQFTGDPERLTEAARRAEDLGFDSIWLFDHLWPLSGGKERPVMECWTTLAYLAAATERITIGTLVTRSSLRHPALLVKMAATVACIAPGRLVVGIGSGDEMSRDENEAFGIEYFAGDERIDQFEETVTVLMRSLHEPEVTLGGDFVSLESFRLSPRPPTPPRVWVGGRSADATAIAGRLADGWNGWSGDPESFAEDAGEVLRAAEGRPVELTWGGLVDLRGSDGGTRAERDAGTISGSPEAIAGALGRFVSAGATHLIVTPAGRWGSAEIERLARDVRPLIA